MNSPFSGDPSSLDWRTAKASAATNCVQIARTAAGVAIRDSKHPDLVVHFLGKAGWSDVVRGIRSR
jgi:hypothetical protein